MKKQHFFLVWTLILIFATQLPGQPNPSPQLTSAPPPGIPAPPHASPVLPHPSLQLPPSSPHPCAHAHNDYEHPNPLHDALAHGFTSVEADIFLIRGKLIVSHIRPFLKKKRTLKDLYLEPLARISQQNALPEQVWGPIHPNPTASGTSTSEAFTLMIDFKTGGMDTYHALLKELKPYESLLQRSTNGKIIPGPVKIVLSGARPPADKINGQDQWVWLDGRPPDLDHSQDIDKIAWISDRYSRHFTWNGKGEMTREEKSHLKDFVTRAHARNAQVRFWATPENEHVWKVLLEAGVDRISTDQLEALDIFLQNNPYLSTQE